MGVTEEGAGKAHWRGLGGFEEDTEEGGAELEGAELLVRRRSEAEGALVVKVVAAEEEKAVAKKGALESGQAVELSDGAGEPERKAIQLRELQ